MDDYVVTDGETTGGEATDNEEVVDLTVDSDDETTNNEEVVDLTVDSDDELENEAAAPENEAAAPENEAAAPENEAAAPESEAAAPESEAAAPESEAAAPESEAAAPESKAAAPESKAAAPESKAAAPESKVEAVPESKPEEAPTMESMSEIAPAVFKDWCECESCRADSAGVGKPLPSPAEEHAFVDFDKCVVICEDAAKAIIRTELGDVTPTLQQLRDIDLVPLHALEYIRRNFHFSPLHLPACKDAGICFCP
jgi:chemotaxis protein histidine kinase CheA